MEVTCPTPSSPPDDSVGVELSYNGVEFFSVSTSTPLMFIERPAISSIEPPFGFADSEIGLTVVGSRLTGVTKAGFTGLGDDGAKLELDITTTADDTRSFVPRSSYANVSTLSDLELFGTTYTMVELASLDAIDYSSDTIRH